MKQIKEKSMVKVTVNLLDGSASEYKGIVAHVKEDLFVLIPFDSISKNAEGMIFLMNEVSDIATARFPQEISDLLKSAYESYRKMKAVEDRIKKLEEELKTNKATYFDRVNEMKEKTEALNSKRFEFIGSHQDIATKMIQDIADKGVRVLFGSGNKVIRVISVKAENKDIIMYIAFEKEIFGENCKELYWLDYERQYDCNDWEAFQEKYCPSVAAYFKGIFPFATVISETKKSGRGEANRRVDLETRYTLSIKVTKLTYSEVLRMLIDGLRRFKDLYVKGNI